MFLSSSIRCMLDWLIGSRFSEGRSRSLGMLEAYEEGDMLWADEEAEDDGFSSEDEDDTAWDFFKKLTVENDETGAGGVESFIGELLRRI